MVVAQMLTLGCRRYDLDLDLENNNKRKGDNYLEWYDAFMKETKGLKLKPFHWSKKGILKYSHPEVLDY